MDRRMMDESRCTMRLISRQSFLDCGLRDSANEALLHHKLHGTPVKRAQRSKDNLEAPPKGDATPRRSRQMLTTAGSMAYDCDPKLRPARGAMDL